MKSSIITQIENSIKEYNDLEVYITSNYKPDITDRTKKIKIGSANMKKNYLATKVIVLSELVEDYKLPEDLQLEKDSYLKLVDSIILSNGEINYSSELNQLMEQVEKIKK